MRIGQQSWNIVRWIRSLYIETIVSHMKIIGGVLRQTARSVWLIIRTLTYASKRHIDPSINTV